MSPNSLRPALLERTEGNPFYVEELVNHLVERGLLVKREDSWVLDRELAPEDLPTTVQGVISARIDGLGAEAKGVLQRASVIGRSFSLRVLEAIVDGAACLRPSLAELEQHDLIRQFHTQSDAEWSFSTL